MWNFFGKIFSDEYVNRPAIGSNGLLLLMYRFAYPFAVILDRLQISPNKITTLSLVFALGSFGALVIDKGWLLFACFWGLAVLFDFCDGTVARMTDKVSKTAFRYDHLSDLFKISLVFLGVAVRYDDMQLWIWAFAATFFLMYGDILNSELRFAISQQVATNTEDLSQSHSGLTNRHWLVVWGAKQALLLRIYRNLRAILLTVNGHFLLWFFVFPFGLRCAQFVFCYLIFIELWAVKSRIATLVRMRRS